MPALRRPSTALLRDPHTDLHAEFAPALAWIEANLDRPDASAALRALLSRDDLPEEALVAITAAALAWIARNEADSGARSLFRRLLERYDFDDETQGQIVDPALGWIERGIEDEESDVVLRALLRRSDLDQTTVTRAVNAALAWLEHFGMTPEAQFTLRVILAREDLEYEQDRRALTAALAWVDSHRELDEASFVLPELLIRDDLAKGEPARVIAAAFAWLARHGSGPSADYVFNALLRSRYLAKDQTSPAARFAIAWLEKTPIERAHVRHHTLMTVLHRAPRLYDDIVEAAVDDACRWIPTAQLAPEVLSTLLFDLNAVARRVNRVAEVRALIRQAPLTAEIPKLPERQFRKLCDDLLAGARDASAPIDMEALRWALAETWRQREHAIFAALHALPGLLALAARTGSEALFAETAQLVTTILRDRRLHEENALRDPRAQNQNVRSALHACRELLSAWPNPAEGERFLAEFDPGPEEA